LCMPAGPTQEEILQALGPFDRVRLNNHWIPISYLRAFTTDGSETGVFWMYDRTRADGPKEIAPRVAAVENQLYVFESDDATEPRDLVERLLARFIEAPYRSISWKLVHGPDVGVQAHLLPDEHFSLALFLAVQYCRTPFFRDRTEWMASFHATLELRATLSNPADAQEDYRRRTGKHVTLDEIRRWRRQLDSGDLQVRPGKGLWLASFLKGAMEIAPFIRTLPWRVVRAPDGIEFPVSDLPLVLALRAPGEPRYALGAGWANSDTEATIPLHPNAVMVLGPNVETDGFIGTPAWCESVRTRHVHHSRRFIFARTRDDAISKVLRSTEPPSTVVDTGKEQFPMAGPVGPVVKRVMESDANIIRFGPPRD